ncbi:unnamed protein product [Allacma fusca]|uniref:Uncharacterized protein n=1 Tax=Allacma fusca TaxID=39272 RepID=A0A8J2PNU1_9HEXA|nr:unnamed protein product [Allacma fusca]
MLHSPFKRSSDQMSWDCNCDEVKSERQDECSCSCAVPKKAGFYNPDTPTIEIDRRIEEAREKAYECQKIWQKVKNSPASGFDEPPPLQFPGTCPPPPEPCHFSRITDVPMKFKLFQ